MTVKCREWDLPFRKFIHCVSGKLESKGSIAKFKAPTFSMLTDL